MGLIDFHSHILPHMDDGSSSVEESLEMLQMCANQNINIIVATPHFYIDKESVESFIHRRQHSYNQLSLSIPNVKNYPSIRLAAEVQYFSGISQFKEIKKLCVLNTNSILIEMPFEQWSNRVLIEIGDLLTTNRLSVIIAHAERYFRYGNNLKNLLSLFELGSVIQVNTNSLTKLLLGLRIFRLLRNGITFVIGTDCHNVVNRLPLYNTAYVKIHKILGINKLEQMNKIALSLL